MIALIFAVAGLTIPAAEPHSCMAAVCIVGENGLLDSVVIDEHDRTITADDSSTLKNVRTDYCLIVRPGAHPKIVNSEFGHLCEHTS